MECLYHYTTAAGLLGIVGEQTIHATHIDFLNDSSEMKTAAPEIIKLFSNEVKEMIVGGQLPYIEIDPTKLQEFCELEGSAAYNAGVVTTSRFSPIFVTSFCKHKVSNDSYDGLLSQWRGYSNTGGYCVVFDKKLLESEFEKSDFANQKFAFRAASDVKYVAKADDIDLVEFKGIVGPLLKNKILKVLEDAASPYFEDAKQKYPKDELGRFTTALFEKTVNTIPFYKNISFTEEDEFRFAVAVYSQSAVPPNGDAPQKFRFRIRGETFVPYVQLFETNTIKLPILEIIVGPHRAAETRRKSVELFMATHGYNIPVRISSIPYESTW